MPATRTTISLEEEVSNLSNQFCKDRNLKFSNLVESLLQRELVSEGYLSASDSTSRLFDLFKGTLEFAKADPQRLSEIENYLESINRELAEK